MYTANEMAERVLVGANLLVGSGASDWEDEELTILLSISQRRVIKSLLTFKQNENRESFEETEVRSQGLSALINTASNITPNPISPDNLSGGRFFNLPSNFYKAILEIVTTNKLDCTKIGNVKLTLSVIPIGHGEYTKFYNSKYRGPIIQYNEGICWRLTYSSSTSSLLDVTAKTPKRHELISNGYEIENYYLRYLKIPENIVVNRDDESEQRNCELDSMVQDAIIDEAISLAKDYTDRQRLFNQKQILNLE